MPTRLTWYYRHVKMHSKNFKNYIYQETVVAEMCWHILLRIKPTICSIFPSVSLDRIAASS